MTDYGRGGVLGAATVLPATSAVGLLFASHTYPLIILGFVIISLASLMVLSFYFFRYLAKRTR